jgi:DNA-binding transcriptional MerR regulator
MESDKFTIPGTSIKVGGLLGSVFTGGFIGNVLSPILGFGSGLLLSQITHIADNLTKETIQNWVKRNFIEPPKKGKFYDENQVARILIFNALRRVLELEDIKLLLQFVYDSSGGSLSEKELLEIFNNSQIRTKGISAGDLEAYDRAVGEDILKSLEKKEGDKAKIKEIVYIMLTAYQSSILKQKADDMIYKLKTVV